MDTIQSTGFRLGKRKTLSRHERKIFNKIHKLAAENMIDGVDFNLNKKELELEFEPTKSNGILIVARAIIAPVASENGVIARSYPNGYRCIFMNVADPNANPENMFSSIVEYVKYFMNDDADRVPKSVNGDVLIIQETNEVE